ncbi:MAG TPA: heavy metal translocating P-type ATPase [Casimicrobiaceae bacterium]
MSARPADACWHCGESLPPGDDIHAVVAGVPHAVCCHGCRAAVEWIDGLGLADYYRLRDSRGNTRRAATRAADPARVADDAATWARPEVAAQVLRNLDGGRCEALLAIDGLRCAACSWLIERAVGALPGVVSVEVNAAARRARITGMRGALALPAIVDTLGRAGYRALPLDARVLDDARRRESREAMKRLAVAGFGAMQAMMYAAALYFGAVERMDAVTRDLFRWLGLLVATPVVFYSARPFFAGARRSLAAGRLGMDVPVAVAVALIYAASVVEAVSGGADVYFDSVSMFVFLLLAGRYLEMRARHRAGELSDALARQSPLFAERIGVDESLMRVAAFELRAGDRVHVAEGATVPADGVLESGACVVDEALLSGEPHAVKKRAGDALLAGSIVVDGPARLAVLRTGADTTLSAIVTLAARAAASKPRLAREGERAAARFVARVLSLAAITAIAWSLVDPARAFAAVLAVLVVSCPCAYALAVPAAVTRALGVLARRRVLVVNADAIEALATATHVVLDKTGTLTEPRLALDQVRVREGVEREVALSLAAALARGSSHPLARVVAACPHRESICVDELRVEELRVEELRVDAGAGISGTVGGARLRLGHAAYALRGSLQRAGATTAATGAIIDPALDDALVLADDKGVLATFRIAEELRPGVRDAVHALRDAGLTVSIASGDSPARVAKLAGELGIAHWEAALTPDAKLARLIRMRADGARVIAVGDGINDAPLLAGADVGVAIGSGTDLARASGDVILVDNRLTDLVGARAIARETIAILAQNRRWALAWNLAAMPLAALGFVPPWLAAAGMSMSSLGVVMNALRIGRRTTRSSTTGATLTAAPAIDGAKSGGAKTGGAKTGGATIILRSDGRATKESPA